MHSQHIEIVNQVKYEHPKCHLYLFVKWENIARLALDTVTRFYAQAELRQCHAHDAQHRSREFQNE